MTGSVSLYPLAMWLGLALVSCTQVTIIPPGATVASVQAGQIGGTATVEHGATRIAIDNRESWTDTTKMVSGITTAITALKGAVALIDMRAAKNAADAATAGAQIAAGTEAQRIAADQAIQSQALTNEAALAAP